MPVVHLFVVPWSVVESGGVAQVVTNLYRNFARGERPSPEILVLSWSHPRPVSVVEHGRRVTYMRVRSPAGCRRAGVRWLKWMLMLPFDVLRLAGYLKDHAIGTINLHYPSLAAVEFILARALLTARPRIVLSFHGLDVASARHAAGFERRAWQFVLRRADAFVTCSHALRGALVDWQPGIAERTTAIHNGLDIAHLMASRDKGARVHPRLRGRRFVLSIASLEHKKGGDVLVRALHRLRRDPRHRDVMLALVGPDRGRGAHLRQLAEALGVSDAVVFCGPVDHGHVHAYYEAATVFCLPSRAEPFGIVLLEAGAFRCPVVATSVGGIPEILTDGVDALLVGPDDPGLLADRLSDLLGDADRCRRLGDALHRRVQLAFSWRRAYAAYLQLVDALLSGRAMHGRPARLGDATPSGDGPRLAPLEAASPLAPPNDF
jgi:glycosyltransferase involved in cell wall biosynthesis